MPAVDRSEPVELAARHAPGTSEAKVFPDRNAARAGRPIEAKHAVARIQSKPTVDSIETKPASAHEELPAALPALLPRLWRFALRLAGDQHDAEDLVQRACVRALERQHQLQPGTSILSWLFSIVHSVWLNEVRARRIRNHASLEWSEHLVEAVVDPTLTPETDLLHQQVVSAVGKLPEAQRAVMLLVAVEGLSYREVAEVLDIPIGTVMSRLARARLTIGQTFGTRC